jgi:hypothetical protein
MAERGFESFNTVPPEERQGDQSTGAVNTEQATTEKTPEVENKGEVQSQSQGTSAGENRTLSAEQGGAQSAQSSEIASTQTDKPDEFIENFNKRYNTQYKADDEIRSLFSLTEKVSEYEGKLKDHESLVESVDRYKQELEDYKVNGMSDLLSKPRIRSAYVAEQLVAKYPDRDPDILANLAMSDLDKMNDLEVLAKERKMRGSKSSLENIKAVIVKELGIDPEQKPEEWDSVVTTELEMKATDARDRIKSLLKDVEIPKVVTAEEREASAAKALEEKVKATTPIKEIFKKFDTYKNGEFEFIVPDEFKSKLEDVFNGMFIDSGLDINEENIATAELIKKALFVEEYLPKMLEVKEKQVLAKLKEEQDALLHNDTPPNTATATDQIDEGDPNRPGLSNFFQNQQQRATKF